MAEPKTKLNDSSVEDFLNKITDKKKREDSFQILELMKKVTKSEPNMWGDSMIGFGKYKFKYSNGREIDWFLTGFSPASRTSLYIL